MFYDLFGATQPAVEAWHDIFRKVEMATAEFANADSYEDIANLKINVAGAD